MVSLSGSEEFAGAAADAPTGGGRVQDARPELDGAAAPRGVTRLFGAISLVDLDSPQEIIWPQVSALRIFAGYSGWSAEQLADERARGGWYVVDSELGDIFDQDPATLWRRVLRRQSGSLRWVSTYPVDPDLN